MGTDRDILDALPVGVWVAKAPSGERIYSNAMFGEILGLRAHGDLAAGESSEPYVIRTAEGEPYPEAQLPFARALRERRSVVIDDLVIHRPDGHRIQVRAQARPVFDDNGEIREIVIVFVDVTREPSPTRTGEGAEDRLRQLQKMESIGRLAGGIAHDFNNLLAAIRVLASTLLRSETEPSKLSALEQIEETTERAAVLTRSLLGFAGRGKHMKAPVSLSEVVRGVTTLLSRTVDPRIHVKSELGSNWFVMGDYSQLEQVVMNLAVNGRDAMPGGGTLTLRTHDIEREGPRPAWLRGVPTGRWIVLEVEDDGTGIDPTIRSRIFEPYFTTKKTEAQPGTGLGLATVYGIVDAHGGILDVADGATCGTVVRVAFPIGSTIMPAVRPAPLAEPRDRSRHSGRVLVCDDDRLVREALRRGLAEFGFDVITAADGADCVELFQKNQPHIDAVLLDMSMPRLNGRETFLRLRELSPGVRVVLMTGHAMNEQAQSILDLGVRAFYQKPFQLRVVAAKLSELCAERPSVPPQ